MRPVNKMGKYLIAIIVIQFLLLGVGAYLYQNSRNHSASLEQVYAEQSDEIKTWKDEAGKYRSQKMAAEVDLKTAKKHYQAEIDGVYHDMHVKYRNLKALVQVNTKTADTITLEKPVYIKGDTIRDSIFIYRDVWADFIATMDSASIDLRYTVRDSLAFVSHYKRTGLFKKQLFIDGVSHNPNTKIVGIKNISIGKPSNRFGLTVGPSVGYGVVGNGLGPFFGVSATYGFHIW